MIYYSQIWPMHSSSTIFPNILQICLLQVYTTHTYYHILSSFSRIMLYFSLFLNAKQSFTFKNQKNLKFIIVSLLQVQFQNQHFIIIKQQRKNSMGVLSFIVIKILKLIGFAVSGPVRGSIAAGIQKLCWGGAVAAGSLFSLAQRMVMGSKK